MVVSHPNCIAYFTGRWHRACLDSLATQRAELIGVPAQRCLALGAGLAGRRHLGAPPMCESHVRAGPRKVAKIMIAHAVRLLPNMMYAYGRLLAVAGVIAAAPLVIVASSASASGSASSGSVHCFGAAARDPAHPCRDRTRSVVPRPRVAAMAPNSPCARVPRTAGPPVCTFGVLAAEAAENIALVGDSHAAHWRAAVNVVAQPKRWHGFSLSRSACSFSVAVKGLREPFSSRCTSWNQSVLAWFWSHPEISTVFVSQHTDPTVVVPPGQTRFGTQVAGYMGAWMALPQTVKHIIVIRDTPVNKVNTIDCVRRAIVRHKRAGVVCAVPRSMALKRDPAISAVSRLRSQRYEAVDLTEFFCGRRLCYPVIGGVLVRKDVDHLTSVFATTLWPFLLRKVEGLMASW